jgi:hypothetical protein
MAPNLPTIAQPLNKAVAVRPAPGMAPASAQEVEENAMPPRSATGPLPATAMRPGAAGRGKVKRKTSRTPARKATRNARAKPTRSKAEFVRARAHLMPREIVRQAKAEGIHLAVGYVYNIRASSKVARAAGSGGPRPAATQWEATMPGRRPATPRTISTITPEDLLQAAAAEIGLGRAIEILTVQRSRLRAVLASRE